MFDVILKSKAFWTAVLAVITAVVSLYLDLPAELWVPVEGLLVVVIGLFTGEDISERISNGIARSLVEGMRELIKPED